MASLRRSPLERRTAWRKSRSLDRHTRARPVKQSMRTAVRPISISAVVFATALGLPSVCAFGSRFAAGRRFRRLQHHADHGQRARPDRHRQLSSLDHVAVFHAAGEGDRHLEMVAAPSQADDQPDRARAVRARPDRDVQQLRLLQLRHRVRRERCAVAEDGVEGALRPARATTPSPNAPGIRAEPGTCSTAP